MKINKQQKQYCPPNLRVEILKLEFAFTASTTKEATHEDYDSIDLFD